jgi:hypothetical protein
MRPQEITITIQAFDLVLKPTLKAACILDEKYHGFEQLARDVADGKFHIIADVLHIGATHNSLSKPAIEYALSKSVATFETISAQVITFILACCGIDDTQVVEPSNQQSTDTLTSFKEHHAKLFRIATGWLGWTPNDTWNATPSEIIEAYKGRTELLGTIFGNGKSNENDETYEPDNTPLDRGGLETLRGFI